jgi:hypothetical protein
VKSPTATLKTEVIQYNENMTVATIDITGTLIDPTIPDLVWTELAVKSFAKLAGRTPSEVRERYPAELRTAIHHPPGLNREYVKVILKTAPGAGAWTK